MSQVNNKYGHKRDYAHPTMIHPPLPTQPTMIAANRVILCKISSLYLGLGAKGKLQYKKFA
jgi:hypothetical protein